jgi:hypothetical protein
MSQLPTMEAPLFFHEQRLQEAISYMQAVTPCIAGKPALLRVFVDSSIVLAVAQLEAFLRSLVGTAAHVRHAALRKHLARNASRHEQAQVRTCDLQQLVRLAGRRVSFENQGKAIDRLFAVLFGCSPWPSHDQRDVVVDMAMVRNMIVHHGGTDVGLGDVGQYARQVRRSDVLTVRRYGDLAVYEVDSPKALLLYRDAMQALVAQTYHLREQLVKSDAWRQLP